MQNKYIRHINNKKLENRSSDPSRRKTGSMRIISK